MQIIRPNVLNIQDLALAYPWGSTNSLDTFIHLKIEQWWRFIDKTNGAF